MPSAFNGKCYDTPQLALAAFQESFPVMTASTMTTHTSSSISGDPGVITYSLNVRNYSASGANFNVINATTQLGSCNAPLPTDFFGTFMIVAALCILVVLGFMVGRSR